MYVCNVSSSPAVYYSTALLSNSKGKFKVTCVIDGMYFIAGASVRTVIQQYVVTFVFVFINMLFAFGLVRLLKHKVASFKLAKFIVKNKHIMLGCFGTAILLVAGIGKLGWSIQTVGGTTPAEKLNEYIFWVLSCVGTFLVFVDIFLTALNDKHNSRR
jgi:hypothetical protein